MATVIYLKYPIRVLQKVESHVIIDDAKGDEMTTSEMGVKIIMANGDELLVPWSNVGVIYTSSKVVSKIERP